MLELSLCGRRETHLSISLRYWILAVFMYQSSLLGWPHGFSRLRSPEQFNPACPATEAVRAFGMNHPTFEAPLRHHGHDKAVHERE